MFCGIQPSLSRDRSPISTDFIIKNSFECFTDKYSCICLLNTMYSLAQNIQSKTDFGPLFLKKSY